VAVHRWTPDRFEAWLAATLLRQLLGRSTGSGRLTAPRS
jgi:hypothetical protein